MSGRGWRMTKWCEFQLHHQTRFYYTGNGCLEGLYSPIAPYLTESVSFCISQGKNKRLTKGKKGSRKKA